MMKKYFETIEDSRQQRKIKYNMLETIIITIIAVIAGAEHWNEIEMYCKAKEEWFREKIWLTLRQYRIMIKNNKPKEKRRELPCVLPILMFER